MLYHLFQYNLTRQMYCLNLSCRGRSRRLFASIKNANSLLIFLDLEQPVHVLAVISHGLWHSIGKIDKIDCHSKMYKMDCSANCTMQCSPNFWYSSSPSQDENLPLHLLILLAPTKIQRCPSSIVRLRTSCTFGEAPLNTQLYQRSVNMLSSCCLKQLQLKLLLNNQLVIPYGTDYLVKQLVQRLEALDIPRALEALDVPVQRTAAARPRQLPRCLLRPLASPPSTITSPWTQREMGQVAW